MSLKPDDLPSDLASAQAALLIEREALRAEREARLRVEAERDATAAKVTRIQAEAINWQAEAANARAELSDNEALIAHLGTPAAAFLFADRQVRQAEGTALTTWAAISDYLQRHQDPN